MKEERKKNAFTLIMQEGIPSKSLIPIVRDEIRHDKTILHTPQHNGVVEKNEVDNYEKI